MKQILFLAATAATIAACHNRNDDQAGPAPSAADTTTTVHVIDSTRTGPPGTAGRPGAATVTPDSVGIPDSAARVDTTMTSPSPTSAPQDTLGPRTTDSTGTDSTSAQ
ncbi:MAG: hypothetical protein ACJ8DJ_01465 [Gemmatimonadales bacterium]